MNTAIKSDGQQLRISGGGFSWVWKLGSIVGAAVFLLGCGSTAAASIGLTQGEVDHSIVVFAVNCTLMFAATYLVLVVCVNRETLYVTKNELSIKQGPLPVVWPRKRSVPTSEINQIIVVEAKNEGVGVYLKDHPGSQNKTLRTSTYEVWALLRRDRKVQVLAINMTGADWWDHDSKTTKKNADKAKRVERQIEEFLGIEDDPTKNKAVKRLHTFVQEKQQYHPPG